MGKKSGVKKETLILRRLVGESDGENEENNTALLDVAMARTLSRVVVKRPLADERPDERNVRQHHRRALAQKRGHLDELTLSPSG